MVGVLGFEPRTSSLSGTRSNQLSYTPLFPLKAPPFGHGPRVFCFAKASGTFRGPRSPAFRAASPYSCLRDWMMSAKNRLVPDCLARYFLIFRSRCDNGAPRHLGVARLPLVEPKGLEPSTSCLQSRCSSQLSYGPLKPY